MLQHMEENRCEMLTELYIKIWEDTKNWELEMILALLKKEMTIEAIMQGSRYWVLFGKYKKESWRREWEKQTNG